MMDRSDEELRAMYEKETPGLKVYFSRDVWNQELKVSDVPSTSDYHLPLGEVLVRVPVSAYPTVSEWHEALHAHKVKMAQAQVVHAKVQVERSEKKLRDLFALEHIVE